MTLDEILKYAEEQRQIITGMLQNYSNKSITTKLDISVHSTSEGSADLFVAALDAGWRDATHTSDIGSAHWSDKSTERTESGLSEITVYLP